MKLPDNMGYYRQIVQEKQGILHFMYSMKIATDIFPVSKYQELKMFFENIVALQNTELMFEKVSL